jgi:hypothetical protein
MIEAGDVLVALVDWAQTWRLGAVQVIDDRSGLAIAGWGRKPADAGAQRVIDQFMRAGAQCARRMRASRRNEQSR